MGRAAEKPKLPGERGELRQRLRAAGYRLTEPRVAVLSVLEDVTRHWSPAEILEAGRQHYRGLSRPTVYRTLEVLTELGLIRPLLLGDGMARYTVTLGGHHHMVCADCGSVEEFDDCGFDGLSAALAERHAFRIGGHLLEVYGTCSACT